MKAKIQNTKQVMIKRVLQALLHPIWVSHSVGNYYQMDGKPEL